jgi:hypothetical protein
VPQIDAYARLTALRNQTLCPLFGKSSGEITHCVSNSSPSSDALLKALIIAICSGVNTGHIGPIRVVISKTNQLLYWNLIGYPAGKKAKLSATIDLPLHVVF